MDYLFQDGGKPKKVGRPKGSKKISSTSGTKTKTGAKSKKGGNFLGSVGELVAPTGWEGFASAAALLAFNRANAALRRGSKKMSGGHHGTSERSFYKHMNALGIKYDQGAKKWMKDFKVVIDPHSYTTRIPITDNNLPPFPIIVDSLSKFYKNKMIDIDPPITHTNLLIASTKKLKELYDKIIKTVTKQNNGPAEVLRNSWGGIIMKPQRTVNNSQNNGSAEVLRNSWGGIITKPQRTVNNSQNNGPAAANNGSAAANNGSAIVRRNDWGGVIGKQRQL
jgi:hypothetical protein